MGRLLLLGLIVAVFASALGVVFSTNESRKLFVELQGLQKVRDELSAEWGRLQLEQSTWATHGRIEQIANNKLEMVNPPPGAVVIVRP
jgi:cell division protein FtsL